MKQLSAVHMDSTHIASQNHLFRKESAMGWQRYFVGRTEKKRFETVLRPFNPKQDQFYQFQVHNIHFRYITYTT